MNAEAMITTLKSLKLFGMAESVAELAAQASPAYRQAVPVLENLLKAEVAEREVRSIHYQMKAAKLKNDNPGSHLGRCSETCFPPM